MRILITAGPTREAIDAVRFISNRSTGKMGYALAQAAVEMGFDVTLISGPVALAEVDGAEMILVESAAEMSAAVTRYFAMSDITIMSAAVADYRPAVRIANKMKKSDGALMLELERTEDILLSLGKIKSTDQILVGFAAETDDVEKNAIGKLERKNLDFIAANDVSAKDCGFGCDTNRVVLYGKNNYVVKIPFGAKIEVARAILINIIGEKI